jgi:hypothetical protein
MDLSSQELPGHEGPERIFLVSSEESHGLQQACPVVAPWLSIGN